jgi:hypothetical protein
MTMVLENGQRPARTFPLEGGPSGAIYVGAAAALAIEGVGIHLYLSSFSRVLAWAFTVANGALLFSFWRSYRALSKSALTVGEEHLDVRLGNHLRCRIARSVIASAEVATWRSLPDTRTDYVNAASPLEPNVLVVLREPSWAKLPFAMRKRFTRLGVRVADAAQLVASLGGGPATLPNLSAPNASAQTRR